MTRRRRRPGQEYSHETTSLATSLPLLWVSTSKVPFMFAVNLTEAGLPGLSSSSLSYPWMCSSSSASLITLTSTVWPAFTLIVAPLGLTLPLATVTSMVTSACSPDGSAVFDGELVFGEPGVGVLVGRLDVGVLAGALGDGVLEPLSESPPPQPARTSMPRVGRRAVAAPRVSVERIGPEAFRGSCEVCGVRDAPSCLTNLDGSVFPVSQSTVGPGR